MGKIINNLAKFAGETVRIKKSSKTFDELDPQTKQKVDNLIKAAQGGNIDAITKLAGFYYSGEYVGYDPQQAIYWWTEAAKKGHVGSQYNLGLMYHGNLTSYSYDENLAGYWFNLASQNGDSESLEMLNEHYRFSKITKKWYKK